MPDVADHYVLKQGDTFLCRFRLRKRGSKGYWNVIGAVIALEWTRDGVVGTAVLANSGHAQAAWGDGYVPILITPGDITAGVATVTAVVRVELNGESVALPHDGHITFDIQPRGEP